MTAAAATSKPPKGGTAPAPAALDIFKYKHMPEDAEALATDLIPTNIMTDLGDANWKTRLAALEEMTEWAEGVVEDVDAEVVVRALAKKGWAEKNFQVQTFWKFKCFDHMLTTFAAGLVQDVWDP